MAKARVHAALLASTAMWGLVFVALFELLQVLDPFQIVTFRFWIASAGFAVLWVASAGIRVRPAGRDLLLLLLMGLTGVVVSQLGPVNGLRFLSPPLVALLMASSPALAAIFAAVILSEGTTPRKVIGFVIAQVGAAAVIVTGSGTGADVRVSNPWGGLVVLVGAASWAMYTVLSKLMTSRYNPVGLVSAATIVGSLFMLPIVPHTAAALPHLSRGHWLWLLFLGIGGTLLPNLIWMWSLRHLEATQTVAYMYLVPLFTLGWSALLLDRMPPLSAFAGGALVLLGVAVTQSGARGERKLAVSRPP